MQALRQVFVKGRSLKRSGQQNTRIAIAVIEIDCYDQFVFGQRLDLGEVRASAICQRVTCRRAFGPATPYSVGVGKCEQDADQFGTSCAAVGGGVAHFFYEVAGNSADSLQAVSINAGGCPLAPDQVDASRDIGIPAGRGASKDIALRQQRGDIGCQRQASDVPGAQQHVG